ncbi:LytTR family DNA-binding domain-containing protein [Pelagibius sp. CAU 1746]|uniref:LytTR family DNA-binding domain-containing protein n=1 Tax=Pelagibius sp. CAU 1746 TaxID=3140370 RepID=UPI00325B2CE5
MAVRMSSTSMPWPFWGLVATLLTGLLLAGHPREAFAEFSLLFSYGYWAVRLLMAYLLFAGCLLLLEMGPLGARLRGRWAWGWLAPAAALITLPFFTLSVTMLDLLLGLPELGIGGFGADSGGAAAAAASASGMAALFAMESLYHLDNHLVLCALIVLPRVVMALQASAAAAEHGGAERSDAGQRDAGQGGAPGRAPFPAPVTLRPATPAAPSFFQRFDPPLRSPVLAVQAQEHYVRVVTAEGAVTTLYRFGDALRELEGQSGLQVHRSFWVADAGVEALKSGKRGLKIVLRNGEQVPVSARHADTVQQRFGERLETVA